jgi:hypothetical protein
MFPEYYQQLFEILFVADAHLAEGQISCKETEINKENV